MHQPRTPSTQNTIHQRGNRIRARDPWQTALGEKPQEQGPWLLSYLDVMTLLFSFFVMLFAYQKAQNAELIRQAQSVRTVVAAIAQDRGPPKSPLSPTSIATSAAISVMKTQAQVLNVARDDARTNAHEMQRQKPGKATPSTSSLDLLPHVGTTLVTDAIASEQTAAQLTSVLKDETDSKRVAISHTATELRMEINESILFDTGSTLLRQHGIDILFLMVPVIAKQPGTICVEGHTDRASINTPQFPSNWELSAARASAVTRYLIQMGLAANRLRAVGMADTRPRASNETPEGRAQNRRVSLVIYLDKMPI